MMNHETKAQELFTSGYNCSQAVLGAFCEELGVDLKTAMKISAPFGAGMGRMREVCGACSGMFMVAGLLYGNEQPVSAAEKNKHYEIVRLLADRFKDENGSIICRTLLGSGAEIGGKPEERTENYYKKRPCAEYVKSAARIMAEYIKENG